MDKIESVLLKDEEGNTIEVDFEEFILLIFDQIMYSQNREFNQRMKDRLYSVGKQVQSEIRYWDQEW